MMRKPFRTLLALALAACAGQPLRAQDRQLDVTQAAASQSQGGYAVSQVLDGDVSTIWHSPWTSATRFPVTLTFRLDQARHVDYVRYTPRTESHGNGNWQQVTVLTSEGDDLAATTGWTERVSANLEGSSSVADLYLGDEGVENVRTIRIRIDSGRGGWASAAEVQFFQADRTKEQTFRAYFDDALCTRLKPSVTGSQDISDPDVRRLVESLLQDSAAYKPFRVGRYEAYRPTASLRQELRLSAQYTNYENPTGIYLTAGQPVCLFVQGIGADPVRLSVKNWLLSEEASTYALRNGLNLITPTTTGNAFVHYYTENHATAPAVGLHFVNATVQGYYDQETMTNQDWARLLAGRSATDSTILITRSRHAQLAYPVCAYLAHCPTDIDSLLTLYQQVQWAMRDVMGLGRYGRQTKNRQLFYATTYGFMAAGGEGAYCHVGSLGSIMRPDAASFGFWAVAHEWGHNNQLSPGFKWSGCGETTNNIYAAWSQHLFRAAGGSLRLEDEVTGINDYKGLRGGRMQVYLEEGVRKGVPWQLQDGPDYHGATPAAKTVADYDETGLYLGQVETTSRNYDHFVKLAPLWQLQLWAQAAGRCPDLYPMLFEGLRTTDQATLAAMTNGQQQMHWMKMACDSARTNLLPFFERAGLLRPISAYIEDYTPGWNKITEAMIDALKAHVADQGYATVTDEINYINAHNQHIYRQRLPLEAPATLGQGCTRQGSRVTVLHSQVRNAVAYETYDSQGQLLRITMYALGSDADHTYTQVLYPTDEDAAYIVAVGYDGTRRRIYAYSAPRLQAGRYYTLRSSRYGNCLSTERCTQDTQGGIAWALTRTAATGAQPAHLWLAEERDGRLLLQNPQTGHYLGGRNYQSFNSLADAEAAPYFVAESIDPEASTWTLALNGSGQYLNSYSATTTGYWSGGAGDANNIWVVEQAQTLSVSVPASGYTSLCLPVGVRLPQGVAAYAIPALADIGGTSHALLDSVGPTLAAHTPVMLHKEGGGEALLTLLPAATAGNMPQTNLLQGNLLARTGLASGSLLLPEGGLLARSAATTVPANGAWLTQDVAGAEVVRLLPPGDCTARLEEELGPWFALGTGNAYGLRTEAYNTLAPAYEAAQQGCTRDRFVQLAQATYSSLRTPEAGLYRLRNVHYGLTLAADSHLRGLDQADGVPSVVELEPAADGTRFALKVQGRYVQQPARSAQVELDDTPTYFTLQPGRPGQLALTADPAQTHAALHLDAASAGHRLVGWTTDASASQWMLEDAGRAVLRTNAVGAAAYATLYTPFAYTLPQGVTAYTAQLQGEELVLSPVAGGAVPAATPVVVVNESASLASVSLTLAPDASEPLQSDLQGTYLQMPWSLDMGLSLGRSGNEVGFYRWQGTTLGANRAYVGTAGSEIKGLAFRFGPHTTALAPVPQAETDDSPRYNLAGQRVSRAYRGLVLQHGRKRLVR